MQPLLDSDPNTSTMRLAAAIYEANNDTPSAVRVLRDAIVKNPTDKTLYVDFAEIALDHQSFQAGIEMINSGLKLQPNAEELYVARGVLYVQLADYEHAEADFERAEQLDPNRDFECGRPKSMLAEEKDQNDPDRALATIKAKLAKNPGDAFLWYLQAAVIFAEIPRARFRRICAGHDLSQESCDSAAFSDCCAQCSGEVLSGLRTKRAGSQRVPARTGAQPGK